jgi:hypothetical protein
MITESRTETPQAFPQVVTVYFAYPLSVLMATI